MSEPYIGEVRMFGFDFPPRGWAQCSGQIMSIQQNQALFSLLGTTYGGNGITTFALPDLRGRSPLHFGTLSGGGSYVLGQMSGEENHTLIQSEIPLHLHTASGNSGAPDSGDPTGNVWATGTANAFSGGTPTAVMNPASVGYAGGNQPHPNMPPYLVVNFSIALVGIFPSRN
ncbi:MAG: tail fiber protein [Vicinamibacteria bacterium]|nr:tail fiber protein [Vicinamibacteria bacterium]